MFSDDALALERGDWGICGVSLRSPDVRDRLAPQDGLYTAVEKSPAGIRRRVIGSVREVLFLGDQREQVQCAAGRGGDADRVADDHRKGLLPRSGDRDGSISAHPDIAHDLAASASTR